MNVYRTHVCNHNIFSFHFFFYWVTTYRYDITEKSNEFYNLALMFALTIDKTLCRGWTVFFSFLVSSTYVKLQTSSFLFYPTRRGVASRWTQTSHCCSAFQKKAHGRKEIHARRYKCILCIRPCAFPESILVTNF